MNTVIRADDAGLPLLSVIAAHRAGKPEIAVIDAGLSGAAGFDLDADMSGRAAPTDANVEAIDHLGYDTVEAAAR